MPHGPRIRGLGQGRQLTVMYGVAADVRLESVHMGHRMGLQVHDSDKRGRSLWLKIMTAP